MIRIARPYVLSLVVLGTITLVAAREDLRADDPPQMEVINLANACPDARVRRLNERDTIRVASWNIQRRVSWEGHLSTAADFIEPYDLIAFQEVSKDAGRVEEILRELNHLNPNGPWTSLISARTGVGGEKERYALVWKKEILTKISGAEDSFIDGQNMARRPFSAHFRVKEPTASRWSGKHPFDFVILVIHTKPDAGQEFAAINLAARNAADQLSEPDILIAGDFNAGPGRDDDFDRAFAGSVSPLLYGTISTMVPTTNPNSKNAAGLDNFLIPHPTVEDYAGQSGVQPFDLSMSVSTAREFSDHRIVWAEFCKDNDSDP